MNKQTIFRSTAVAATVVALLTASTASAQLGDAEIACRAAMAKGYAKVVKTAIKTIAGCHKAREKGDTSLTNADCNDMAVADLAKGKYASAVDKYATKLDDTCGNGNDSLSAANNNGIEWYVSCPVTCPGAANPLISMENVGQCQGCIIEGLVETAADTSLGMPTLPLSTGEQKCRASITKGYAKYVAAALKAENSCQGNTDDASPNTINGTSHLGCVNDDPDSKASAALDGADNAMVEACSAPDVTIADLDGCAADTATNLKNCTRTAWIDAEDDSYLAIYDQMAPAACPNHIRTTIQAGCSTQGSVAGICSSGFETGTTLSVGWTGLAHGVDVVDSYTLAGDVSCKQCVGAPNAGEGCSSDSDCTPGTCTQVGTFGTCGECKITGISYDNPQYDDFLRCKDDTSVACSVPFGVDPVCPSSHACRYYLGPPLAVIADGLPTCSFNRIESDITGTVDPDAGSSALLVDLRAEVHSGVSKRHPCPICRNDTVPQDGVRSGICFGGPNDGDPCDVQGFDLTFAPTNAATPTSGNSLDCSLDTGTNISGLGLKISLPLSTGTVTKDAVDPCEAPNGGTDCFCGTCSLLSSKTCDSDADCTGLGDCGPYGGENRKQNQCSDDICTPVPGQTDRGDCETDPQDVDSYCDGLLFANGHGILPCGDNTDCDSASNVGGDPDLWNCPGDDCGTCSVSFFRSCFVDPISLTGTPDTENPTLVGAFCLPPSSNGSVNGASGTPGPGTVQAESVVEKRY